MHTTARDWVVLILTAGLFACGAGDVASNTGGSTSHQDNTPSSGTSTGAGGGTTAGGHQISTTGSSVTTGGASLGTTSGGTASAWTGTWSVAPQAGGSAFNQQTLRQIIHTSVGGLSARVHLSNAFGTQPLYINDVHMAQVTANSSINAASDRPVTFAGAMSVTIAAGAEATSDAVAFSVGALSDVAISFYLPQASASATYHAVGNQTNYVVSGDMSGHATLPGAKTNGVYSFLSGVDVQNPNVMGAVVTFGASITDGVGSSSDDNRRWPNDLAKRLIIAGGIVGVLNQGISGNRLLQDGTGASALHRFSRDVLAQPNVRWVIFSDDPINDLGNTPRPTSDQLIAGLKTLAAQAHQNNLKFICSTLTPFAGAGYWTEEGEHSREAVNAFIRGAQSGCDGVVDQDMATHDPAHPTQYLPAYDSGDHLHPNETGLQAIADAVDLALLR